MRKPSAREAGSGYIPLVCLGIGTGAGAWFAYFVGAVELPFALMGAVGGYLLSGAILRRIYSRSK